jgi:hypothetical protein
MLTRSIADELEIRSLVHRYADAASRRDRSADGAVTVLPFPTDVRTIG